MVGASGFSQFCNVKNSGGVVIDGFIEEVAGFDSKRFSKKNFYQTQWARW
jgi:hypothetical protein